MNEAKVKFITKNFEFFVLPASERVCKQTTNWIKVFKTLLISNLSHWTARRDTWLKDLEARVEFEQTKIFKLNKYIIKMA